MWERVRSVQQEIAESDDDPARYRAMGIDVIFGQATLTGPHAVRVGGRTLPTRFVLLYTGSKPAVPPVSGLPEAGFLTSETLFTVKEPPQSCVVIGGGPIAEEMAQALNRLGVRVQLLQKGDRILPRDEPELTDLLTAALRSEGVDVNLGVDIDRVQVNGHSKVVDGTHRAGFDDGEGAEILVAAGPPAHDRGPRARRDRGRVRPRGRHRG